MRPLVSTALVVSVLCMPNSLLAQRIGPARLKELVQDRPELVGAAPSKGSCITDYSTLKTGSAYSVSGSTATMPVTFSRIEKGDDDKYHVGAALDIGIGYTWFSGSGDFLAVQDGDNKPAGGSLDVSPEIFGGFAINPGIRNDNAELGGSFSGTVFVGFKVVAISAGYDVIAKSPVFGISTKIDPFKFKRGTGARLCVKNGF